MNKVKMLFMAAALVLVTVGVFAGRPRFTAGPLYASIMASPTTSNSFQLTSSTTLVDLTTTGTTGQATITDVNNNVYKVYLNTTGTTLVPVFSTSAW